MTRVNSLCSLSTIVEHVIVKSLAANTADTMVLCLAHTLLKIKNKMKRTMSVLIMIATFLGGGFLHAAAKQEIPKVLQKQMDEKSACVSRARIKELLKNEPPIQELYNVAMNYAGIDPKEIPKWRKNVKNATWLPKLQIGVSRGYNDRVTVNVDDNVSVNTSGVVIGPQSSSWDRYANSDTSFDIKASWELDRLIFSREMLSVSSEARQLAMDRREILDQINAAYHERIKLIALSSCSESGELSDSGLIDIYISRQASTLDALTGGWYSLWKKGER